MFRIKLLMLLALPVASLLGGCGLLAIETATPVDTRLWIEDCANRGILPCRAVLPTVDGLAGDVVMLFPNPANILELEVQRRGLTEDGFLRSPEREAFARAHLALASQADASGMTTLDGRRHGISCPAVGCRLDGTIEISTNPIGSVFVNGRVYFLKDSFLSF